MLIIFDPLNGGIIFERSIYLVDEDSIWVLGTGIWNDNAYWGDDDIWDDE